MEIYADAICRHVQETGARTIAIVHNPVLRDDTKRARSSFYGFEFERLREHLQSSIGSATIAVIRNSELAKLKTLGAWDIVMIDDVDPSCTDFSINAREVYPSLSLVNLLTDRTSVKQLCLRRDLSTPNWVTLGPEMPLDFDWLEESLGRFVVVKDRNHLPSWHEEKVRGEFVDLHCEIDRRLLERFASRRQCLVETVTTWSRDSRGHSGELRIHIVAKRPPQGTPA